MSGLQPQIRRYSLTQGQAVAVSRSGPTAHLVNDPLRDLATVYRTLDGDHVQAVAAHVLVGFDRLPAIGNFDADVPPFSEAWLNVPPGVQALYLLWPTDNAAALSSINSAPFTVYVDWLDCETRPGNSPGGVPVLTQIAGNSRLRLATDGTGAVWPMGSPSLGMVYDQQWNGVFGPHERPRLPASVVDTVHAVTAINTLFTFQGQAAFLQAAVHLQAVVVHRIIVSVSAATLFVVGGNGLTVGSPGAQEMGRLAFAAGGTQVIEYGPEGIELNANSLNSGAWKAYTSAAVTVDATIIGG